MLKIVIGFRDTFGFFLGFFLTASSAALKCSCIEGVSDLERGLERKMEGFSAHARNRSRVTILSEKLHTYRYVSGGSYKRWCFKCLWLWYIYVLVYYIVWYIHIYTYIELCHPCWCGDL